MKVCLRCGTIFKAKAWLCPSCKYSPKTIEGHYVLSPDLNSSSLGFRQDDFEKFFDLEASSFWFVSRNLLITWAIEKYFNPQGRMLEVGCGTGFVLTAIRQAFPELSLTGSDISIVGLTFANKRVKNAELVQFDANMIPYYNEFDIVGAFDVLEHIEDDEHILNQMYKAVVTGGGIIITVPQHPFLWSQADESVCHLRRYSAKQLKEIVVSAGFEVVHTTSFVTLLFPLMIFTRFLKKSKACKDNMLSELKLNNYINSIFYKVIALERLVIKLGFKLPFGGSLLLIARKVS